MAVLKASDDARDLWRAFAEHHGVSVAALLEAFGQWLPTEELPDSLAPVVEEARAIDADRRRRG